MENNQDIVESNEPDRSKLYAIFEVASMRLMADQVGVHAVDDEVLLNLSQDVNYRMRELIHSAANFMKHSRRRQLNTEDINRAIKHTNHHPIHGIPKETDFKHIPEADVYCIEDPLIDVTAQTEKIIESKNRIKGVTRKSLDVSLDWLTVEGRVVAKMVDPDSLPQTNNKINSLLITYLDQASKTILKSDGKALKILLKDLSTNPKIQPIVGHLLTFLLNSIKRPQTKCLTTKKIFKVIESLLNNDNLLLATECHENCLLDIVFHVAFPPNHHRGTDSFTLIESAALLASKIVHHFETYPDIIVISSIRQRLLDKIIKSISNHSPESFSSHYGAINTLICLGWPEIRKNLVVIIEFVKFLDKFIDDESNQSKQEAHRLRSLVMRASVALIKGLHNDCLGSDSDVVKLNDLKVIYSILYEHFGDGLSTQTSDLLTINDRILVYTPVPKEMDKSLFVTPDLEKSGEELLDQFFSDDHHESSNPHLIKSLQNYGNHSKSSDHKAVTLSAHGFKPNEGGTKRQKIEPFDMNQAFDGYKVIETRSPIKVTISSQLEETPTSVESLFSDEPFI